MINNNDNGSYGKHRPKRSYMRQKEEEKKNENKQNVHHKNN